MARYLVTGALPYSNGRLHVGHVAGAYLPADIFVRYLRAAGHEVRFVCGSDDNGVAVPITAMKEGRSPQEVCRHYNARQHADFTGLGVEFDIYGGTHQPDFVELHSRISQQMFLSIFEKGYFTKKRTKQLFDAQADKFLPDRYVKGKCPLCGYEAAYGDQCESCGKSMDALALINPVSTLTGAKPEVRETTHWYLRLDQFNKPLMNYLDGHPEWRTSVLNFSRGLLKEGLPERAMTRDLDWGVPVPLDDPDAAGKVLYVWFDAPIGYVSFTARHCEKTGGSWEDYAAWWKDENTKIYHFIGEDNTIFHALIWPAMLMAEGTFQLPHNVVANAFVNIKFPGKEAEKISKSRGTAIWIEEYLKTFDPDPLRYYLTSIAPENQRTAFDIEDFAQRNNAELIANIGNFFNRWQKIVTDDFGRKIPQIDESALTAADREMLAGGPERVEDKVGKCIEACRFKEALQHVRDFGQRCNLYIDGVAPWKTRKTDMARTALTIYVCANASRRLASIMYPFLPFSAKKAYEMLGLDSSSFRWGDADVPLPPGHALGEPQVLFRKLDLDQLFTPPAE